MNIEGPAGALAVSLIEPESVSGESRAAAVLFIHPTNMSSECWLPVSRLLPRYRKVMPDSRGHGSSHRNGPFFIADYAADVLAVIDALALDRVHLVGASLGGSIACAVARERPDRVRSLVGIGAALEPADAQVLAALGRMSSGELVELLDQDSELEGEHGLSPEAASAVRRQACLDQRDADMVRTITLNAFSEDGRVYAEGVRCPAYIMNGEFDRSCPADAGERMARLLNARYETLPEVGHLVMMQSPELIARKLERFFDEVEST